MTPIAVDIKAIPVGPIQENAYLVRTPESDEAILIDPGDDAERIAREIEDAGVKVAAILITHCHFDHIGAVAETAKATGAPVYVSETEQPILADINSYVPFPGFGPFESYEADHTLKGGERLDLAGLAVEVRSTPGHSPGHLTYVLPEAGAIFCGDVLFRGSVGRTDLPGSDAPTLARSIAGLFDGLDDDTVVYPGHMEPTTIGTERRTNPFVREISR